MPEQIYGTERALPPPPPDWQPQAYTPPPPPKKKNRLAKLVVVLIVLLLLFSILFVTPFGNLLFASLTGDTYPESTTFTLIREISIDVRNGEIDYAYDIPKPVNVQYGIGIAQTIVQIQNSPTPASITKYNGTWFQWTGTSGSIVTMDVTYEASVKTLIWNIGPDDSGTGDDIPADMSFQTGNEWEIEESNGNPTGEYMIWPTNPTISNLANSLTSDGATVIENVEAIYNYIRKNYDYQTLSDSEPKSCLQTLNDGRGDCDDQSILFISLCRSVGIPSWLAFGTLYDGSSDAWGAHAWTEVYIPLIEGNGANVVIDSVNGEFLVRNCNRMEEWKSDGNGEHLADYYHVLSYNYTQTNPHQQAPVVVLSEEYSGTYDASGKWISGYILAEPGKHELL